MKDRNEIVELLRSQPFQPFTVRMSNGQSYEVPYPELADAHNDVLLNPLVIIKVLSPFTEAYDRGRKFGHHKSIPSLREYVLVAQDRASIDHFARQSDGRWLMTSVADLKGALVLPALEVSVPAAEVYAKVEFPPEEERIPSAETSQS